MGEMPNVVTVDDKGFLGLQMLVQPGGGHDRWAFAQDETGRVGVVADGMGGMSGAAEAAQRSVELLERGLAKAPPDPGAFCGELVTCDREVSELEDGGQAAVAAIRLTATHLFAASIGDAEVWISTRGTVKRLSGRRKHGTGFAMGSSVAMPDFALVPRQEVTWVALLTDGVLRCFPADQLPNFLGLREPLSRWRSHLEQQGPHFDDDLTLLLTRP